MRFVRLMRGRAAPTAALAAVGALALAVVAATSLALAGVQLGANGSDGHRSSETRSDPRTPADTGLTATPTTLLWSAAVPSASAPASHHRLAEKVRRVAATLPARSARRHGLGSRGAVRTRAQRWFARRNLEGG